MARIYVSLGSNVERELRIREAVDALRETFGEIELSPVYDTVAVGFEGDNFLNLVACFETPLAVEKVAAAFHDIEDRHCHCQSFRALAVRKAAHPGIVSTESAASSSMR